MRKTISPILIAGLAMCADSVAAQPSSIDVEPVTATIFKRQGEEIRVYSAKLICGSVGDTTMFADRVIGGLPVAPGEYLTAINIHNPDPDNTVTFTKKVAEALPQRARQIGEVSERETDELGPDEALEVDCADAFLLLGRDEVEAEAIVPAFLKGFVVIETRGRPNAAPLDVVGVYTVSADQRRVPPSEL